MPGIAKLTALLFCIFPVAGALAQTTPATTPPPPSYGWKNSLVAGLTLTQVSFTDWAQGGENALAYATTLDGKSENDLESENWTNVYKLAFGQTRLGDQALRKTDDIIDLSTVYTLKLNAYVNPYAAATMKTQFAKGFMYPKPDSGVQVSAFFDPAYLTQSAGAGYQPVKEVKTRIGLALREVLTSSFNQYTDDPLTKEVEKSTVDGGLESVTNVDWNLAENIILSSQLELFDPFKHLDELVVRNTTTITGKVNKYVTAIFGLQVINEKRISPKTQIKETIALGLSYALFQ